jgi:hypothetical protein
MVMGDPSRLAPAADAAASEAARLDDRRPLRKAAGRALRARFRLDNPGFATQIESGK